MSTDDAPLRALATRVRQRRETLGLKIEEAAKLAGFGSVNTWLNIEHARKVRGLSYARAEEVLGWVPGSFDQIRAGGEPSLRDGVDASTEQQVLDAIAAIKNPAMDWGGEDVREFMLRRAEAQLAQVREQAEQNRRVSG